MELKHLIIAAIVANAAKSGRPAAPGSTPALTFAIPEDARPSYGTFASLMNAWNRHQRCVEKTEKNGRHGVSPAYPILFAVPLPATDVCAHLGKVLRKYLPWTCYGASPAFGLAKNATRCGFSARQHPNFQRIRAGWRCTALGPCGTASGHRPTERAMSGQGPEQTPSWRPRTTG